jgi:eukaryotic-like serine/threonine-protein kinase
MGGITRGARVGRYELVQILGEGGMGTVWLAHPYDAPEQLYAIKTVSAQYAADPRVCTMFVKEASLAASIDHPNVVHLYDVGLHEDVPFFVMEWIDGFSLRNVAKAVTESGERVPASIALRIASDLCGGLHAAHELCSDDGTPLGLVHRDVSPHNVLVTREGVAKLIDFGVAKARDLATGADQSVCGGLKGKVRYMAPEQALEKEIDRRADLFSVGAVVYQLLTGRAPFEGPNELAIINSLLSTNPVYVPEDLPEPVQWILRRALARRPEQRFADAAEMQNAIELALVELGQPDTHHDVAESLQWFDPRPEEDEITSQRLAVSGNNGHQSGNGPTRGSGSNPLAPPLPDSGRMRPGTSQFPDPISAAGPSSGPYRDPNAPINTPSFSIPPVPNAASIPARQSSLVDEDERKPRQRYPASSQGSFRFILLAAGFVGVLGLIAVLMVRDNPRRPSSGTSSVNTTSGASLDSNPIPIPTTTSTVLVPASPNTPIIDMGDLDEKTGKPTGKPRVKRPGGGPLPPPAPHPPGPAKSGDLAGPIKVWK